jgi:hypothetical protein
MCSGCAAAAASLTGEPLPARTSRKPSARKPAAPRAARAAPASAKMMMSALRRILGGW